MDMFVHYWILLNGQPLVTFKYCFKRNNSGNFYAFYIKHGKSHHNVERLSFVFRDQGIVECVSDRFKGWDSRYVIPGYSDSRFPHLAKEEFGSDMV